VVVAVVVMGAVMGEQWVITGQKRVAVKKTRLDLLDDKTAFDFVIQPWHSPPPQPNPLPTYPLFHSPAPGLPPPRQQSS